MTPVPVTGGRTGPNAPVPPAPPPGAPATPPTSVGPRLVVDRAEHDFGPAAQEEELRTEFVLKNEGDAPLVFRAVRADCGCAGAVADATELAPGASTTVRVVLRTLTLSGIVRKRVLIDSNDPARPTTELGIKVDIFQGIVLAPARFFFGDVAAGSAPSSTMRILWREGHGTPFRLTGVEAPGLDLDLKTAPVDDDGWKGFAVTATFKAPPPVGTVSGTVILRTDDPRHPRFTAAVQAFVSGKVWVDRRSVSLGLVPSGAGRETAVIARPFRPGLDLGTVTARARKGVVTARVVPSGREWVVVIRVPESAPPGRFEDVVEVASSLPGEPPAEVRVVGSVTEPVK